ncbi:MAG: ATP-binding cassette domain-containing protein, partial [Oscillospiraceae bacterium]|nr:ATP-binding cassette domain-containing protein [Oscillospiraceae bacterium]
CLNSTGLFSFYTKKQKCIAMENMKLFGIKQLKKRSFKELSGGQQQRVLLARAFCATKKLLLLDEPCTGLDPMVAKELYKIIKTINADKGIAVIMVSHDIKTAVSNADKILHIQKKPLFLGTTREYCQSLIGKRFLRGV